MNRCTVGIRNSTTVVTSRPIITHSTAFAIFVVFFKIDAKIRFREQKTKEKRFFLFILN